MAVSPHIIRLELKTCGSCDTIKPLHRFRLTGSGKPRSKCMACENPSRNAWQRADYSKGAASRQRAWRLENPEKQAIATLRAKAAEYGLDPDKVQVYYNAHSGLCDICGSVPVERSRNGGPIKRLSIDHNHVTGEFRGLLCQPCNKSLGGFKDNPELLYKAIQYLQKGRD